MGAVGLVVAETLHPGQLARLPGRQQRAQAGVQTEAVVQSQDRIRGDRQPRAQTVVVRVRVGDQGVEPVVAALELHEHQGAGPGGLGRDLLGSAGPGRKHGPDSGPPQEVAPLHRWPFYLSW
jgi:hypothetical protein